MGSKAERPLQFSSSKTVHFERNRSVSGSVNFDPFDAQSRSVAVFRIPSAIVHFASITMLFSAELCFSTDTIPRLHLAIKSDPLARTDISAVVVIAKSLSRPVNNEVGLAAVSHLGALFFF